MSCIFIVSHNFNISSFLNFSKTTLIADHQHLQLCIYAGEQNSIGYVLDNDVYYLEDVAAGPAAVRLTNDGVPGVIYNGVADWVYEGC